MSRLCDGEWWKIQWGKENLSDYDAVVLSATSFFPQCVPNRTDACTVPIRLSAQRPRHANNNNVKPSIKW